MDRGEGSPRAVRCAHLSGRRGQHGRPRGPPGASGRRPYGGSRPRARSTITPQPGKSKPILDTPPQKNAVGPVLYFGRNFKDQIISEQIIWAGGSVLAGLIWSEDATKGGFIIGPKTIIFAKNNTTESKWRPGRQATPTQQKKHLLNNKPHCIQFTLRFFGISSLKENLPSKGDKR